MFNAVTGNGKYTPEVRYPYYAKLGLLGDTSRDEDGEPDTDPDDYGYQPPAPSPEPVSDGTHDASPWNAAPPDPAPVPPPPPSGGTAEEMQRELWGDQGTPAEEDDPEGDDGWGAGWTDDDEPAEEPNPIGTGDASNPGGSSTPDPEEERTHERTNSQYSQDAHSAADLWANANVLVQIAIGMDTSGHKFTEAEIEELCTLAYNLFLKFTQEG